MEHDRVETQLIAAFARDIISTNIPNQQESIDLLYDDNCKLQNPYLKLANKAEIMKSYEQLALSCTELTAQVNSVTYEEGDSTAVIDLDQVLVPKALGGLVPIKIHQIIKLQLKPDETGLIRITDHSELHVAQDYMSNVPVVGKWYNEGSLRSTVGQLSLTGNALINASGLLNYVPGAVQTAVNTTSAARQKAGEIVGQARELGGSVASSLGATSILNQAITSARSALGSVSETSVQETVASIYSGVQQKGLTFFYATAPAPEGVEVPEVPIEKVQVETAAALEK